MDKTLSRQRVLAGVVGLWVFLTLLAIPVQANELQGIDCKETLSSSLKALKPIAKFTGSLESQCQEREAGFTRTAGAGESPLLMGHTLSDLLAYSPWKRDVAPVDSEDEGFALQIGGGVRLLANHINVVSSMVRLILHSQNAFTPEELKQQQEWILQVGDFASVVAKADFIQGLMPYLIQNLLSSDFPLPTDEGDITLTFNLKSGAAGIDIDTILKGTTLLQSGKNLLNAFGIDQVTVKISNGVLQSEADLNPKDWSLQGGKVNLNWDFGPNAISSTTVFSKGHGVEKQILQLTAQLGSVNLLGQATFAASLQEFKLQASLADLLTVSTLLTPTGFAKPTFGFDITIPFFKKH